MLAYIPQVGSSWALPISTERLQPDETEVKLAIRQITQLCESMVHDIVQVIVLDGRYGNHMFLKEVQDFPCAEVVRLRRDRVLYQEPLYCGAVAHPYMGNALPSKNRTPGERRTKK